MKQQCFRMKVRRLIPFFRRRDWAKKIEKDEGYLMEKSLRECELRIVHAGGFVEKYYVAIRAAEVLEKHPGLCLARPEVFKRPQESLVSPDESLLPGQKFLLVPQSTVRKLRERHSERSLELAERAFERDSVVKKCEEGEDGEDCSICSAREFFLARDRWSTCIRKRWTNMSASKKPFRPPIKRGLQGPGWQPSLTSVKELSP
ncbi:hypothetical protein AMTRI_Chr06g176800 [Amborella trichopoda]